jgi:hypothetical protein
MAFWDRAICEQALQYLVAAIGGMKQGCIMPDMGLPINDFIYEGIA